MGNRLLFIAAVLAVLTIGTAFYMQAAAPISVQTQQASDVQSSPADTTASQSSTAQTQPSTTPAPTPTSAPAKSGYTLADVSQHSNASSCWSAINGKVYDLTNWINEHPGGPEHILALCGTDGSAAFNAQHDATGEPERVLQTFFIGDLI